MELDISPTPTSARSRWTLRRARSTRQPMGPGLVCSRRTRQLHARVPAVQPTVLVHRASPTAPDRSDRLRHARDNQTILASKISTIGSRRLTMSIARSSIRRLSTFSRQAELLSLHNGSLTWQIYSVSSSGCRRTPRSPPSADASCGRSAAATTMSQSATRIPGP
jgi:hypothetical protein